MKAGKLAESALKRSVLKQLHSENANVVTGALYGCDTSAIAVKEGEQVALSTEPVIVNCEEQAATAVAKVLNNVSTTGATPIGVLTNLLLPTSCNENDLRAIIKSMDTACIQANVKLMGGHTQVTRAVNAPVITATGVGILQEGVLYQASMVEPGMDILVTKWIGMEGTALLARKMDTELQTRYTVPFLDKARALLDGIMAYPEAAVAAKSGVSAMHDVEEGGIFAALWEMAEASGVGLEIDLKQIPIRQETVEICEFFDLNPYKLLSGGCMLMAARDGNALKQALLNAGIQATVIGKATDSNDRVLLSDGERRFLETAQTDEIYKVKELLN